MIVCKPNKHNLPAIHSEYINAKFEKIIEILCNSDDLPLLTGVVRNLASVSANIAAHRIYTENQTVMMLDDPCQFAQGYQPIGVFYTVVRNTECLVWSRKSISFNLLHFILEHNSWAQGQDIQYILS